jgi:trimeric autotransporter adhesin
MRVNHWMAAALAMFFCLNISIDAYADVPATMTYHGKLSDGSGRPLDATVEATFKLYDAENAGSEVWSESEMTIDVVGGSFTTQLGASVSLVNVFDGAPYWLEVSINGETLSPRTPVESVPYALRANRANDANTLGGQSAAELTASVAVPTTAAELAYDNTSSGLAAADIQAALDELAQLRARIEGLDANAADTSLANRVSQNETAIATLEAGVQANAEAISTNADAISNNAEAISNNAEAIAAHAALITTNQSDIAIHASEITALQNLTQDMERTTINGYPALTFTAINLHVRSGLGATDGNTGNGPQVNGLGNLIVGYDELRATDSDKSGSHNLIVGSEHNYPGHAGFVAGIRNTITGPYATVSGGRNNTASASYSSVSGGINNTASRALSSVSGGYGNIASGFYSSVSGGFNNTASASYSSVSGGRDNTALGGFSSVSGGHTNIASGSHSSVSGGRENTASGMDSSVSGGNLNNAFGSHSSVSGGFSNTASRIYSSVSGGSSNTASGDYSSVSGGRNRSATGSHNWAAGGLLESL